MKPVLIAGIFVLLLTVMIVGVACSQKTTRTLLSENKVYLWKIYHVQENRYPAGKYHYFEVYYGNQKLVLPKELTGGAREVSQFHAAGGHGPHETNYDTVLIVFEGFTKDARSFEQRSIVSISVRPETGHGDSLRITNLCNGQTALLAPG